MESMDAPVMTSLISVSFSAGSGSKLMVSFTIPRRSRKVGIHLRATTFIIVEREEGEREGGREACVERGRERRMYYTAT